MPYNRAGIGTSPLRILVKRCVVIGHGFPVKTVPPNLLRKYPDTDLDIVGRFQHLFHRPAIPFDPVGIDLHDPHVKRASGAHGPLSVLDGFFFRPGSYIPPRNIDDPRMAAAFLPGDGQGQHFGHLIAGTGRVKQRFQFLLTILANLANNRAMRKSMMFKPLQSRAYAG